MDIVLNQAYQLFPDSKAAKKEGKEGEGGESKDGGSGGDDEMSTEAVAMAYLLKGVHF
ncbi:MAG: hypothetical protein WKF40_01075 [Thermoleophilaceae bacterium]